MSLTVPVNKHIYIRICVNGHCSERKKKKSKHVYLRACLFGSEKTRRPAKMAVFIIVFIQILLLLLCFSHFLVADDDHKPKTRVNMSIRMKHIVCIYCLLSYSEAQNNHYHSSIGRN